ncbi:hypothetical protein OV211_25015, partial [Salmonella enterica subsp. enterica serovar 1,4,[5],12:i:-]|nr:hypothetical protein [Salmonella enterica subsp. enterica serovar 1,4,[5],12:i:-]
SEWLQERRYSYAFTEDEEILSIDKEKTIVDKHILDKLTIKIVNNLERKHTKTDLTLQHQGCLVVELNEEFNLESIEKLVIELKYFLMLFTQY